MIFLNQERKRELLILPEMGKELAEVSEKR